MENLIQGMEDRKIIIVVSNETYPNIYHMAILCRKFSIKEFIEFY